MATVYSFTDKNGKRGVIGSYVYPAVVYFQDATDEQRRAAAKKVVKIIKEGQTFLKFEDGPGMVSYA
jgi:hypothetical protein